MKIKKEKAVNKLIEELDALHSEYVRRKAADQNGIVKCYTCNKKDNWKKMQCGHFQSRKHRATRWEMMNTKPQCTGCNIFKYGEQYTFGKNLDLEYGAGTSERMEQAAKGTSKLTRADLIWMIDEYKHLIEKL